jgi:hydrogenase maturation protease
VRRLGAGTADIRCVLTVIGLGSELSGDDAVGLALVERLRGRVTDAPISCELWPDADALSIAHDLLTLDTTSLLVDCAEMGLPPGSHRLLERGEARLRIKHSAISVHGIGVAEAIELAEALGLQRAVHLFAVQPHTVEPLAALSSAMERRLPELLDSLEEACRQLAGRAA